MRIRPRCLIDVSTIDTGIETLGFKVKIPFGICPVAMQKMAHSDGEIGSAKAIGSFGGIFILSTLSTCSLEDVAKEAPNTIKWFQLYIYKNRTLSESIVRRAETAGFKALVLTVDANVFGIRYSDEKNGFTLPPHLKLANFSNVSNFANSNDGSQLRNYTVGLFDPNISWDDIAWLKSITKLPIILKGIMTWEDTKLAVQYGASAIMVSNHGGRQLDSAPSTVEALPEIVNAVNGEIDVYVDGGIRYGSDIFKCLALGAKMVFFGRPTVWGLAHSGQKGVERVSEILLKELVITLGLTGCTKISDIRKEMVIHELYYNKL